MTTIKRLTIIDDNDLFVYLTKKIITLSGVVESVSVFDNGLDALDFFKENHSNHEVIPQVVFLDLSMPIMDGWQFLERYAVINSELLKTVKIYIITSSISPDDIARAKAINVVTDFLIKPINKEKIIALVKAA